MPTLRPAPIPASRDVPPLHEAHDFRRPTSFPSAMTTPATPPYDQLAPASLYLLSPGFTFIPVASPVQPGSCFLLPASCFLLPASYWGFVALLPPFPRPTIPGPDISDSLRFARVDTLRPALVFLDCPATLASPSAHPAPPRPYLARPCCLLPPAPFESVTPTDVARFASRPCAKWVDGATPHPFPPDNPTAANAHAAPTHLALLLPCGVLICRPVGASPPPRPRFHQICSPPSRLSSV